MNYNNDVEKSTNLRLVIQAESQQLLLKFLDYIRVGYDEAIQYQSAVRRNTRIPFPKGVHCTLNLSLPEVDSE